MPVPWLAVEKAELDQRARGAATAVDRLGDCELHGQLGDARPPQARASAVHLRVVAGKPLLAAIAKATDYVHQEQAAHNFVARTAMHE